MDEILKKHGVAYPACGAEVGDGWLPIVDRLVGDLIAMGWGRDLAQIKEKFGGFRFYADDLSEEMYARVEQAKEEAWHTCEDCGAPGEVGGTRWLRTLCASCLGGRNG